MFDACFVTTFWWMSMFDVRFLVTLSTGDIRNMTHTRHFFHAPVCLSLPTNACSICTHAHTPKHDIPFKVGNVAIDNTCKALCRMSLHSAQRAPQQHLRLHPPAHPFTHHTQSREQQLHGVGGDGPVSRPRGRPVRPAFRGRGRSHRQQAQGCGRGPDGNGEGLFFAVLS